MKASVKIVLIIAVSFIAIGAVIAGAAYFAGGARAVGSGEAKSEHYVFDSTISDIKIECVESSVQILPSEDGVCRVTTLETERAYHSVRLSGTTLIISREDGRSWYERLINFGFRKMELTVYLPEGEYKSLKIETVSGAVEVAKGPEFEQAAARSMSGRVEFNAKATSELELYSTSGSVRADGVEVERISAETVSGRLALSNINCNRVEVNSISGSVTLVNLVASGRLNAETISGSIRLEDCDGGDIKLNSVSGSVGGTLLTPKRFNTSTVSGRVNVPAGTEGGSCEVSTVSGRIDFTIKE